MRFLAKGRILIEKYIITTIDFNKEEVVKFSFATICTILSFFIICSYAFELLAEIPRSNRIAFKKRCLG
jgi:hypothetical protein